jgi:phosphatidylserine/phosphatidylglycerophosphate/cardiolipin synthase-like enzyme
MRSAALLAVAAIACGGSRPKYEVAAKDLQVRLRGKSVFGPVREWVPPDDDDPMYGVFIDRTAPECEVAILPGGEDSFAARMDLLARAKKSIRIEALIFTGDEAGLRVAEVLKAKKAAGLDVKVIVDAVNNLGMQTQWMLFDLKQHGVEVEGYEVLGLHLVDEIPSPFLAPFAKHGPNNRYHEKLWIIDAGTPDAEAVMGGLNIANEYFRVDPTNVARYWRDQDVLVRRAIVDDLAGAFDRNWQHFKARRAGAADAAWGLARSIMQKTGVPNIPFTRDARLAGTIAAFETRPLARDYKPAHCRFFQNRPRLHETYIQQAYMRLFDSAQKEVLVANAYFLPTPSTLLMIREAAKRCVRVVILGNSPATNDTPGMNSLARGYYKDILAVNETPAVKACTNGGGVEIWEWLGKSPADAKQTQGLLHAKYAVVDRKIALVGSYNLDARSERLNSESAIVFENAELGAQLGALHDRDLASSRRITAEEAATFERAETVQKRMAHQLATAFEDQL